MAEQTLVCETQVETSGKAIIMKIPCFLALPSNSSFSIQSKPFYFANATWCIYLYPNGRIDYNEFDGEEEEEDDNYGISKYLEIRLKRLHSDMDSHFIYFSCNIMAPESRSSQISSQKQFHFDLSNPEGDLNFFCDVSRLFRMRNRTIPGGTLTLLCQLFCDESNGVDASSQTIIHELDSGIGSASQSYKDMLLNGQDHNLILKIKDKKFRVHRDILRARSKVFQNMLNHEMTEKQSDVIDVSDCDPQAMQQFLYYMYSGKVETLDENNVFEIYYIADKYNMICLKEECSEFIKTSLSSSSICDIINLALKHSDAFLINSATEYFLNNINDILPTEEWKLFFIENPSQANELIIKAAKRWNPQTN